MVGSYQALRDDQRLETETSLVNSYMIETTYRRADQTHGFVDSAVSVLSPTTLGPRIELKVHQSDDPSL